MKLTREPEKFKCKHKQNNIGAMSPKLDFNEDGISSTILKQTSNALAYRIVIAFALMCEHHCLVLVFELHVHV